jgi:hypothetical protein
MRAFFWQLTPWLLSIAVWVVIIMVVYALLGGGHPDLSDTCYARC